MNLQDFHQGPLSFYFELYQLKLESFADDFCLLQDNHSFEQDTLPYALD